MLSQEIIGLLSAVCCPEHVVTEPMELLPYESDHTMGMRFPFDVLVKPADTSEVSAVVKICAKHQIPVTPRGGGSGVTGGALPVKGGVVLSLERLNHIVEINKDENFIIAEAGVITSDLCRAAEIEGLYFPVAPSSQDFSFVGGNVAQNAGSIRSCKYGTTADYVMNLEVVLPDGTILWTGANVSKNSTGLNLTQLITGSEGQLCIITKVVYRLIAFPGEKLLLLAPFSNISLACDAVLSIRRSAFTPSALELIDQFAIQITNTYLSTSYPFTSKYIQAHLLLELQDNHTDRLWEVAAIATATLEKYACEEPVVASSKAEQDRLWSLRLNIGNALTQNTVYRDIDISLPVSFISNYIHGVQKICERYDIPVACFGHALDGNIHTMLVVEQHPTEVRQHAIECAAREIYSFAISAGGIISGEHGIGFLQKDLMPLQFMPRHLQLMKDIKQLFDPQGILNPGKAF